MKLGTIVAGTVPTAAEWNAGAGAWTTWSPTYTNLTVGNGTVTAKYSFFGRTVFWKWQLIFGSTSAITGSLAMSMPVTAADAVEWYEATPMITDVSAGTLYTGVLVASSTTVLQIFVQSVAGTYGQIAALSSTVPMTWATGDLIRATGTYEAIS